MQTVTFWTDNMVERGEKEATYVTLEQPPETTISHLNCSLEIYFQETRLVNQDFCHNYDHPGTRAAKRAFLETCVKKGGQTPPAGQSDSRWHNDWNI